MKFGFVVLTTLLLSSSVFAASKCETTATQAVQKKYSKYFSQNGKTIREFNFKICSKMRSSQGNGYVKCELSAIATNDDAGSVDFVALMNFDCSRSFAQFLIAEE